jgi:hypothetical protein
MRRPGRIIGRTILTFSLRRQPVNGVAALYALSVRPNLADTLEEDLDPDALLAQASEEAPDGVRCPAHRLSDLRSTGPSSRRSMARIWDCFVSRGGRGSWAIWILQAASQDGRHGR